MRCGPDGRGLTAARSRTTASRPLIKSCSGSPLKGTLIDFGRYFDKETQKELLEQEGHIIVQANPNRRTYQVENYKAALFDLNKLIINE